MTATHPAAEAPPAEAPAQTSTEAVTAPRRASLTGLVVLLVVVVGAGLLSLAVGSRALSPGAVVDALLHPDGSQVSAIVNGLRLPRTVLAISVGASLGTAGALMQGHTRNPLADPGLLGVSYGASFAVVLGIFVLGVSSTSAYAWLAIVGAGLASVAVFAIGSGRGGPNPVTLVLAGAAVSALLSSLTQAVVLHDTQTLDRYRFWAVGSVSGRSLEVFVQVLPFMVVGLVLAALSAPALNVLQLGDDVARSLGMHPGRQKVIGIGAVMLLAGAGTAACGPIAFLGLVVPHLARILAGVDHRWLLPYSALVGALVLTLADVLGRLVVPPGELQVGIVMALVGGPVFVLLVRRARLVRL